MSEQKRNQIHFMQEIARNYDIFQSKFFAMFDQLSKAEDLLGKYNIKSLSINDEKTELQIKIIGEIITVEYSISPTEHMGTEIGKLTFLKINNDTKRTITEMYFDRYTLFKDIELKNRVCDIDGKYFHEHFLFTFMDILLRNLGFIK